MEWRRTDSSSHLETMARTYDLNGRTVALLATNGYERSELERPLEALREAGADVHVVSLPSSAERIRGWSGSDWDGSVDVDRTVDDVRSADYDALVLPGGVINPDLLRREAAAVDFVRDFFEDGKPVSAICHAPWMLAEADVLDGRKVTSFSSIRTDLENAGANWVDEEVVVDQGLVTSRSPEDLPAFVDKMLEEIAEGVHAGQVA